MPLALMLLVFVTRAVFVYRGGMPEPDSVVMAAGMAKGMAPDVGLGDATLYGRQLSPAMYAFVDAVYPIFFRTPAHLMGFLNWIAVVAASLLVLPLTAILRRHMPDLAVAGTVLIAAFAPVVWEWGTYFHPLVPAFLLLLVAMAGGARVRATTAGWVWMGIVLICSTSALVIRAEVLFVVPAILLWALIAPGARMRRVAVTGSALLVALVGYTLVLRTLPAPSESPSHDLGGYASMIYHMYIESFSLPGLTRSVTWAVLSMGTATIAAAAWGLTRFLASLRHAPMRRWDESRALVTAALLWILPSLLFWLPQPTPIMRHYVLAAFGVSWLTGYLVLRRLSSRLALATIAVVVAVNLALPEAAYRGYNARHPEAAKFPHGAFFYEQREVRRDIARHRRMAEDVLRRTEAAGAAVLVNWEGYAYVLYELYAGPHRVERVRMQRPNPNVTCERFRVDGEDLVVVQGIRLAPGDLPARAARACLDDAIGEGLRVFVPAEAVGAGFTNDALGTEVVTY